MHSVERLFADIRNAMPVDFDVTVCFSTFLSRGVWRRIYNVVEAVFRQGEINHITGDVHFLATLLFRRRTILTILDCVGLERSRGLRKWVLWCMWYWFPMRRVSAVTVISHATKRELLSYVNFDESNIHVIHCCVSDIFVSDVRSFRASCPQILQVGTGSNKNIERVAAALIGIKCKWVIVGRLSERQISLIERNGIAYENYLNLSDEAMLDRYKSADMLVFASTYEGFGLPIVEANAVGRPVITSDLSSMPEVAGSAACLVDPYDIQSIRAGILRVIEDEHWRDGLVRAGFANAQRFRSTEIAAQYARLYSQLYESQ